MLFIIILIIFHCVCVQMMAGLIKFCRRVHKAFKRKTMIKTDTAGGESKRIGIISSSVALSYNKENNNTQSTKK